MYDAQEVPTNIALPKQTDTVNISPDFPAGDNSSSRSASHGDREKFLRLPTLPARSALGCDESGMTVSSSSCGSEAVVVCISTSVLSETSNDSEPSKSRTGRNRVLVLPPLPPSYKHLGNVSPMTSWLRVPAVGSTVLPASASEQTRFIYTSTDVISSVSLPLGNSYGFVLRPFDDGVQRTIIGLVEHEAGVHNNEQICALDRRFVLMMRRNL